MKTAPQTQGRGSVSGVGIGLRDIHFHQLMEGRQAVPWLEVLADNYLIGGIARHQLQRAAERYPLTMHCVGMNLGGSGSLDRTYIERVGEMARDTGAAWISDHLCFTAHAGRHYHDLLPLPFSDEAVMHVAARIQIAQDILQQRLLVENVSAYVRADTPMTEAQFIAEVCAEADCDLLLDINNLYVNQVNLGFDACEALGALPLDRVRELHLAGYEDKGRYLVDAHNNPVSDAVWDLFSECLRVLPETPVCIEWDNNIPTLDVLISQASTAAGIVALVQEDAA